MIDPNADDADILKEARKLFSYGVDHYDKNRAEMHRASRFYHNTRGRGQWEQEDLQYLDEQARPALCFNLIRPKIDTWVGMYQDGARYATVSPTGGNDKLLSDVLERICQQVYEMGDADAADEDVLLGGCVKGERNLHLDVRPDPEDPSFIRIDFHPVSPHDILWDPGSERPDRSDARYVFWDKWLTKGEFESEYPDAPDFEDLERGMDPNSEYLDSSTDETRSEGEFYQKDTDYPGEGTETYYYDRHLRKLRVIHCEYKVPVKRMYAVNPVSGLSERVEKKMVKTIESYKEQGIEGFDDINIVEVFEDVVYTVEFVGNAILWKSEKNKPYQPYDGFSLEPFICYLDDEDGVPYGMVRNLFDPQSEINKAHSQTLDVLVGQQTAGVIAEEGAISDVDDFEEALHTQGSVALVADGALSGNRLKERELPQLSAGIESRLERGVSMVDRISSISTDIESPAAQQEAATTVQIRYHKSRLSMSHVIKNHERFGRNVKRRVMQTISRVMTDFQITELLGDDDRFQVQQGSVQEVEPGQDGEMQPTGEPVTLNDLRMLKHNIKLETTSENSTLRLMELGGLLQLFQLQAPVDPIMLVEKSVTSTADKDRLRKYAREQSASQEASQQQQQAAMAEQVDKALAVERAKVAESSRHNQVDETLDAKKLSDRRMISLMELWEKADEHEKGRILERMKASNDAMKAREGNETAIVTTAMRGVGGGANSGSA